MTPLLYAIKMKSPECVEVLLYKGANPELSIKLSDPDFPEDESRQKSLDTKALDYAIGEKKKASPQDIVLYEDIIDILDEIKTKSKQGQKNDAPQQNPNKPTTLNLSSQTVPMGMDIIMSPTAVADAHRTAQRTIKNQLDIKKLTEENELLKKDVEMLKREIERFKPWVERWIFQGGPSPSPSPLPGVNSPQNEPPRKTSDEKPKRRHKSVHSMEEPRSSKVKSPSKGARDKPESRGKGTKQGSTRPKSTIQHSKTPPGRSVSEKAKGEENKRRT